MFSLFRAKPKSQLIPELPNLDKTFYPLFWQEHRFKSALELTQFVMRQQFDSQQKNSLQQQSNLQETLGEQHCLTQQQLVDLQCQFSQKLLANEIYQSWINFTVFGRYVQRSFSAFYRQTEDVFNADMPELLRHELMRHTQYLPNGQVLLFGGQLSNTVRQEKLIIATLNPYKAINDALNQHYKHSQKTKLLKFLTAPTLIINLLTAGSENVKAFAVKHNKRTRDAMRNEVMILEFNHLTLSKEEVYNNQAQPELSYLVRHYKIS